MSLLAGLVDPLDDRVEALALVALDAEEVPRAVLLDALAVEAFYGHHLAQLRGHGLMRSGEACN